MKTRIIGVVFALGLAVTSCTGDALADPDDFTLPYLAGLVTTAAISEPIAPPNPVLPPNPILPPNPVYPFTQGFDVSLFAKSCSPAVLEPGEECDLVIIVD